MPSKGRTDAEGRWNGIRIRLGEISGSRGPAGPPGITREVWRGAWADDTDYHEGDIVERDHGLGSGLVRTYICTEDHHSAGDGPTPGGTTYWHEFNESDLIIDGSRAMVGNLDMNHHDVANAKDVEVEGNETFTGGVGVAKIVNPRVLTMAGAEADGEARVEAVKALAFDEVTPTPEYGRTAVDATEGTFVIFVHSGATLVLVAAGWAVKLAIVAAAP